jgi:hypothetical protein
MYKKLFFAIAAMVLFATSAQAQRNKGLTAIDVLSSLSAGGNTIVGPGFKTTEFNNEIFFTFNPARTLQFGNTREICITVIYLGDDPPIIRFFNENGVTGWPGDTSNVVMEWTMQEGQRADGQCLFGVGSFHAGCTNTAAACSFAYRIDEWDPPVAP